MDSYDEIISRFSSRKILVAGDVILDQYIWGNADRISPEAPVPIVVVEDDTDYRLGGAANVVANICSLSGSAYLVSVVGGDSDGFRLAKMLRVIGADINDLIRIGDRPTTIKTRVVAHQQQVVRIDKEVKSPIIGAQRQLLIDRVKATIQNVDAVLISDYDKGVMSDPILSTIIELGQEHNLPVVIDPRHGSIHGYEGATVLTPNLKELSATGMAVDNDASILQAGKFMLGALKLQALLVTRGKDGMTLLRGAGPSTPAIHIQTTAQNVFDVTGAGDTVIAVFTLALVSGADFITAAKISNYAAGIVIGELGTACVTQDELIQHIRTEGGMQC